jgi:hypothetical protein
MFFRARHGAFRASDTWEKIGFALHITLMAANKVARRFEADHVVFALEGRSWRKDHYKPYKANRAVARAALTEKEAEEDAMFWETYDNLTKYLSERTNCSVVRCPTAEADDIIARWIAVVFLSPPPRERRIVSHAVDKRPGLGPFAKRRHRPPHRQQQFLHQIMPVRTDCEPVGDMVQHRPVRVQPAFEACVMFVRIHRCAAPLDAARPFSLHTANRFFEFPSSRRCPDN